MRSNSFSEKEMELSRRIAEELRRLRDEQHLSVEDLSKKLVEQYGYEISTESLKNFESSGKTREGANLGMKLLSLYYLADYYGISTDSLLFGENSFPYSDRTYQNLKLLSRSKEEKDTFEKMLLKYSVFKKFIDTICLARAKTAAMIRKAMDPETDETDLNALRYEAKHLKRDTAEDIEDALEEICRFKTLSRLIEDDELDEYPILDEDIFQEFPEE